MPQSLSTKAKYSSAASRKPVPTIVIRFPGGSGKDGVTVNCNVFPTQSPNDGVTVKRKSLKGGSSLSGNPRRNRESGNTSSHPWQAILP